MTLVDISRYRGPGTCLEPLWLQSMIGHRQRVIEMVVAGEIDPLTKTLEAR